MSEKSNRNDLILVARHPGGSKNMKRLLYAEGGQDLGYAVRDASGYWDYQDPRVSSGTLSAGLLRLIADKLDEMNHEWDQKVKELAAKAYGEKQEESPL